MFVAIKKDSTIAFGEVDNLREKFPGQPVIEFCKDEISKLPESFIRDYLLGLVHAN